MAVVAAETRTFEQADSTGTAVRQTQSGSFKMRQSTITTGVLVTWTLWALVTVFAVAGWVVWALGGSNMLAGLLGLTAAAVVGPATVAHARLYVCRLAFVIRATAEAQPAKGIRPV